VHGPLEGLTLLEELNNNVNFKLERHTIMN